MAPVSRQELSTLLEDAKLVSRGVPGIELRRDRVVDVLSRALADSRSVGVHEIDAIIDACTRLRAEMADLPPRGAEVGTRIREARRCAGLTQVQLAEKLEVNQTTVARWETGVLSPNHRHRLRLVDLLGGRPADYEE